MARFKVVPTGDGSKTVRDTLLDVTYHSIHGALTESQHVFMQAGLKQYFTTHGTESDVRILEMGYGTGLNALLTYQYSLGQGNQIHYTSIESTPLPEDIVDSLGYDQLMGIEVPDAMHAPDRTSDWSEINDKFRLRFVMGTIEQDLPAGPYDLVFYDAFGPGTQSGLWGMDVLDKVVEQMAPGAMLVTFCAQGQFKRNLKALGLSVESIPGPPGKREMVRALKAS